MNTMLGRFSSAAWAGVAGIDGRAAQAKSTAASLTMARRATVAAGFFMRSARDEIDSETQGERARPSPRRDFVVLRRSWVRLKAAVLKPGDVRRASRSGLLLGGIDRLALPRPDAVLLGQEPREAARDRRRVRLGQPFRERALGLGVGRVAGQVRPFVGIGPTVVELLGAVGVADVAPVFGANGVVVLVVRGDRRPEARGVRVLHLRRK